MAPGAFPTEVIDEANALGAGITVTADSSQPAWVVVALDEHGTASGGVEPWLEPVGVAVLGTVQKTSALSAHCVQSVSSARVLL